MIQSKNYSIHTMCGKQFYEIDEANFGITPTLTKIISMLKYLSNIFIWYLFF